MSSIEELKREACATIEAGKQEILQVAREVLENPETASSAVAARGQPSVYSGSWIHCLSSTTPSPTPTPARPTPAATTPRSA